MVIQLYIISQRRIKAGYNSDMTLAAEVMEGLPSRMAEGPGKEGLRPWA